MKKLLLLVAVAIAAVHAFSATIYTVSSSGTNSGTSWTTVKAAITAAASGDIIQIAAGTFTEKNITLNAVKSLTIQGAGMNQTIIQADASTSITQANDCGVFKLDGTYTAGITITIQDMTIQNGYNSFSGGGIRLANTGTQANAPTINLTNLKISANRSPYGGGVYIQGAALLTINGCNITGNSQTTTTSNIGGGIGVTPGTGNLANVTIKNSTISGNSSVGNGGGIAITCGGNGANTSAVNSLWIENSTIYGNSISTSAKIGAGIYYKTCGTTGNSAHTNNLTLNHCTIVSNTTNAGTGGDGVCIDNSGGYATTVAMNNSIIMGNSGSTSNASQIGSNNNSTSTTANGKITASPVITNSIFGIIASGTWATTTTHNNLTATLGDLAFAGLLSSQSTPVLLIGSGSAAKDWVTTNLLSPALSTDQIGNPRYNSIADAGAYEYNASLIIAASATSGGTVTSGTGNFASGASTTLVATATGSNAFANWTENGVVVSTNASYTFTVTRACTLVANFTVHYNVQTANDGNGSVTGAATVASGNPVTLTATPNAGYAFSAWTVTAGTTPSISTTTNPLTFTPSADCTISASFVSITALTPTVTYARTASTIDVLVTNPTGYIGTLTYKVLDGNDNILATGISATSLPETATLAYSATGLSANTSYTYKVVAVINATINSTTATLTALTRKHANGSVQVIDDFEDGNGLGWLNQSTVTLTVPYTNTVTGGVNSSANCAKVNIPVSSVSYAGFLNTLERFEVGPNAPYQYLHIKMYRDADNGKLGLTFMKRNDITLAQLSAAEAHTVSSVSASGPWVDYVFDLKNAAYATDKTFFGFYIKPNFTSPSNTGVESNCFIDDVYLSNDASPTTTNITIPVTISTGTGGTVSQTSNTYLSGENATVVATPSTGYRFVNWTLNTSGGAEQSTSASYSFTVSENKTLVANFAANTVNVSSDVNISTLSPTSATDVTVSAGYELTVTADAEVKSITVAPGAKLTLTSGALTLTNGITLQNTASATASFVDSRVADFPTAIAGTVEQAITETNRNWYVAVPVTGKLASDITLSGAKIVQRNEALSRWDDVVSGAGLTAGVGYIAVASASSGTTSWSLNGNLNSGKVEVGVTRSGASSIGFNLLGNPYPSYLNWEQVLSLNSTNASLLQSSIWYRTKSGASYAFQTYNSAGRVATPTNTTGYIPPMQAFWVRANAAGTVTFTNTMRSHGDGASNKLKAPKVNTQQIIRLQVSNTAATDEAVIYIDQNAQNTFDRYDTEKMFNNVVSQPELYTKAGTEKLVINGLSEISDNQEIPLGLTYTQGGDLKLKLTELNNFDSNTKVYLRDKQLSTETELSPETEYTFNTAATTNNESRFSLLFRAPGATTGIEKTEKGNTLVFVNAANQITIIAPEKSNYAIYNAVGQKVEEGITTSNLQTSNVKLASGVYVVYVCENGKSNSTCVILNGK